MSQFEELINRCQELYEDLSLTYVREWKKKNGAKAMGFLPVYFPRELIYAAGMLPVGIMGGGDQVEIIKGDAYYQSYICHIPRSVVELGLRGDLDDLDGMIFPSICDVIRNLSGIWKMTFKDKVSFYFDAPQNLKMSVGGAFYKEEMERAIAIFEEMTGRKVSHDDLAAATELYNQNRSLIEQLYRHRSEKPWDIPTTELYLLLRAGNILDVKEHNDMLKTYLELAPQQGRHKRDNTRIVLKGSFCEQPPLGLIRALERSGGYIVDDDFVLVSRWIKHAISTEGDILQNFVEAYINDSKEGAFKYHPKDKGKELVDSFHDNDAEGVVFCAASFCDPGL